MIFLVVGCIAFAIVLVAAGSRSAQKRQRPEVSTAQVWGTPDEFAQKLSLKLAGLPRHSFSYGPGTVVVTYRRTPLWAILVAIFLFPIGLIALVAKKEDNGTIAMTAAGERTNSAISGYFTNPAQGRINQAIEAASTPSPKRVADPGGREIQA